MEGEEEEVRLVRKAKRMVPMEGKGESRRRAKYQALLQDYKDLLKETEVKKKGLENIKTRKLGLLAEIKFLRRKCESFAKSLSGRTHYRLKKQAHRMPSPVQNDDASAFSNHGATMEVASTSTNANLDLNQESLPNDEETGFQMHRHHPKIEKSYQPGVDEDMVISNLNLPICRDVGNTSMSDDKRMITWQDQVPMKSNPLVYCE